MISPLSILVLAILPLVAIPLTIFAVLTTILACFALTARLSILYCELGLALIHSALFPAKSAVSIPTRTARHGPGRRRRSRGSSAANLPLVAAENKTMYMATKSDSSISLFACGASNRDFEGVGGWRTPAAGEEEDNWISLKSRLELSNIEVEQRRRHQRSLTAGSERWASSPNAIRISPVQSRARTPIASLAEVDGYFMLQPHMKMSQSIDTGRQSGPPSRRQSVSAKSVESGSSTPSSPSLTLRGRGE